MHAGTGGVGLAASNVVKALGCSVFATAGTAQKRSLLRSLGAQIAASSRDTDFVDVMAYHEGDSSLLQCPSQQLHSSRVLLPPEALPERFHVIWKADQRFHKLSHRKHY